MFDLTGWGSGTWLWLVIDVVAVVVLGAAMLYASRTWLTRSPAGRDATEEATRGLYASEAKEETKSEKSGKSRRAF